MRTIINAVLIYLVLLFLMRLTGRRAPNMMTPFDMVLIFLLAGLSVPAIMRDERSLMNAFLGITTIGMMHLIVSTIKQKSSMLRKILDGTPVVLFSNGVWHREVMYRMRIQDQDVIAAAREAGIDSEEKIKYAILERDGNISVLRHEESKE